jgi:hypothetical protein
MGRGRCENAVLESLRSASPSTRCQAAPCSVRFGTTGDTTGPKSVGLSLPVTSLRLEDQTVADDIDEMVGSAESPGASVQAVLKSSDYRDFGRSKPREV